MSDFYVGYLPKAPSTLAQFVRKVVFVLGFLAVSLALLLIVELGPFARSTFVYGEVRRFEGMVEAAPYRTLLVSRP